MAMTLETKQHVPQIPANARMVWLSIPNDLKRDAMLC